MDSTPSASPDVREGQGEILCVKCNRMLPQDFFDPKAPRSIRLYCRTCQKQTMDALHAERAESVAAESLTKMVRSAKEPTIHEVLVEIHDVFGGARGFAEKLHKVLENQLDRPKIPYQAALIMTNLLRLQLHDEQNREQKRVNDMTDEQIREERELARQRMLMEMLGDPVKFEQARRILASRGVEIVEPPKLTEDKPVDTTPLIEAPAVYVDADDPDVIRKAKINALIDRLEPGFDHD